jgi:hypothetical protein
MRKKESGTHLCFLLTALGSIDFGKSKRENGNCSGHSVAKQLSDEKRSNGSNSRQHGAISTDIPKDAFYACCDVFFGRDFMRGGH